MKIECVPEECNWFSVIHECHWNHQEFTFFYEPVFKVFRYASFTFSGQLLLLE